MSLKNKFENRFSKPDFGFQTENRFSKPKTGFWFSNQKSDFRFSINIPSLGCSVMCLMSSVSAFSEYLAKEGNDLFWSFVDPISRMQIQYLDCESDDQLYV